MTNLKTWLQTANGWKRLWFVASALLLFYATLINPFTMTAEVRKGSYPFKWSVEKDYKNPSCKPYWTMPIVELKEPEYDSDGGSCWHLYTHRKYGDSKKLPYTLEDYNSHFTWEAWEAILTVMGFGFVCSLILSALVYFSGRVIGWVFAGFKK